MNNIMRVSLFFKILFQIILFALPLLLVIEWLYAPQPLIFLNGVFQLNAIPSSYLGLHIYSPNGLSENVILSSLTIYQKLIGCAISFIPTLIEMIIAMLLIQLFALYQKGEIFSKRNVDYIRSIGYALVIGQLIEPLYQVAMGVVLTYNNPPKHHFASITFGQTNIGMLLTALLIILVSWIMSEGYRLREEQQLTV